MVQDDTNTNIYHSLFLDPHQPVADSGSDLNGLWSHPHNDATSFPHQIYTSRAIAYEGNHSMSNINIIPSTSSHDSAHPLNATLTTPDVVATGAALTLTSVECTKEKDQATQDSFDGVFGFLTAAENKVDKRLQSVTGLAASALAVSTPAVGCENHREAHTEQAIPTCGQGLPRETTRHEGDELETNITQSFHTLEFGTDHSFNDNGYKPPANQQLMRQNADTILHFFDYIEHDSGSTSTRTLSSMQNEHSQSDSVDLQGSSTSQSLVNELFDKGELKVTQHSEVLRPKKRGRGKVNGEYDNDEDGHYDEDGYCDEDGHYDEDDDDQELNSNFCHSRAKRRKSSFSAILDVVFQKESKKNFTQEEKRVNHAGSEQKRRSGLSECFIAIASLVPELRNSKHTKSEQLQIAAQWLENLVAGNTELEEQLSSLQS